MKFGIQLHLDRGADAVLQEACLADQQGFDSVWLFDHLIGLGGPQKADGPLDPLTTMIAIGAATKRVRLAWAMLNPMFRNPAVLAKMLATLDHITHGRVICSIGAGWNKEECDAYDIPFIDDHDERVQQERELLLLFKELWTHPAPEQVTFDGKYVRARNLAFNPAPVQKPYPPFWIGGESPATIALVKELADGWVTIRAANPETLAELRQAPDWPSRPLTIVKGQQIVVAPTRSKAEELAAKVFELTPSRAGAPATLEEFMQREIVGTPEECRRRLDEMASWGVNYLRLSFQTDEQQNLFARLLLG